MWRQAWAAATVDACMEAPCRKTNHIPATNVQLNVEIGEISWGLARINLLFYDSLAHHQVQSQTAFSPLTGEACTGAAQRSFRMLCCCRWDIHQFTFLPGALRFLLGSLSLASSLGFGGFHCVLGRPAAQVMNLKGLMNTDCVSSPQNKWYDVSYMNFTSALEVTCWKAQNCHLPAFPVLRSNQQKLLCVRPHLLSNVSSYWSSEDWVWKWLKFINS